MTRSRSRRAGCRNSGSNPKLWKLKASFDN
jgi:hypothetical protein